MPNASAGFALQFAHTLDRTERYVLMLHYAEELTIDEIGQVLDLPPYRVEAILDDLRARTRVALAKQNAA
ncbi:MAG: sigma factor-like helix-turn-helix DNA-binding protein [Planctomycetota bacterium]